MSQPLPCSKFKQLSEAEVAAFDLNATDLNDPIGYILEVDLSYPSHLHDLHSDYPLAPEHLKIEKDMLSGFSSTFLDHMHWMPSEKLAPNLRDKSNYVVHYENLKFYVKHGMVITKIHRILSFEQRAWLKPWVDYCTLGRQNAKTPYEVELYKGLVCSVFGKTMENMRRRKNYRLICDENALLKAVSGPAFETCQIINSDLNLVQNARGQLKLDKPIYAGFTILETAKLHMFRFYYDYLMVRYGGPERCSLLYTDTDSFMLQIQTEDLHADMLADAHIYDCSNFPVDHPNYSTVNARVVGKFKSETANLHPLQFVGLRPKMYSLDVPDLIGKRPLTCKGVKKSFVEKKLKHEDYLRVLHSKERTRAEFCVIRSRNHQLETARLRKACLAAFDDKRYILSDGVHTYAHGHYRAIV
jgi:hypothetical protein